MANGDREALLVAQMDELRHRLRNHLQNMTSLITLHSGAPASRDGGGTGRFARPLCKHHQHLHRS